MKSACSNSTFLRMDMSGSIRIQSRGESALQREQETVSGGKTCRHQRELGSVTSHSMADRSMSTSSPFIRGIFFFLFLGKEAIWGDITTKSPLWRRWNVPWRVLKAWARTYRLLLEWQGMSCFRLFSSIWSMWLKDPSSSCTVTLMGPCKHQDS